MSGSVEGGAGIELLCIGNAIVDVFVKAERDWLEGRGIREPSQHVSRDEASRMLDDLRLAPRGAAGGPTFASGGAAANVAKVASMLGARTAFVGCVGGDDLGGLFEREMTEAGVSCFLSRGSERTGLCLAFDSGTETRLAASPGASLEFTEDDAPEGLIAGADALALDGFMLDRGPLVKRVLRLANAHGIPIALDAASVFHIKEKTEAILQYSRNYPLIVFMNADESIMFYDTIRKGGGADESVKSMTEREKEAFILREVCPVLKCMTDGDIFPVIVIKLGGRGAVVLAGGNVHRAGTFAIVPRNSVGAGDAFCAAFLSAWIRGKSIRDCATLGNKVAREALMVSGTGLKREKLAAFSRFLR